MSAGGSHQDGLDVSRPGEITEAEIEAYRATYTRSNKGLLDSFEFWLEFRPDVLKRHKARTRFYESDREPARPLVGVLGALHQYTVSAFAQGIGYEVRLAQSLGARRTDLLDTLSLAFVHSGHRGMYAAASHAQLLRDHADADADVDAGERFPDGWSFDAMAFASGMDFEQRDATRADVQALRGWYERTLGEVPRYVGFLARHRPGLLKSYRDRYEHAIRDSLPAQMLPWVMLNHDVVRGFADGIREHVLLGRALGMTREQLLDAICFGVLHAGIEAIAIADDAAGDVLEDMA